MAEHYHIGKCPLCAQGRLLLFRNSETGDIYGHCEECEQGYLTPEELEAAGGGFLTTLSDDAAEWASAEEIGRSVWANYRVWPVPSADGDAIVSDGEEGDNPVR
jgi:hypothetical protein